ncbi:MAG TPA: formiminotransferase-cyclodeaminase [Herpetosiphon sp.]|uniref:Formiminotransferase-cyclodeaminase n=2 Tax=Herpetosiphon TaxID=64 RepID=A9AZP8_HERA2|nr:cyclodeaminase/cyclohydrolase family protein [Herpetosiphon sp.]ABX07102.1 Formiminotransferase-cyclodeaminase [Herpetosiphon aurantiacus DSM 785]MCA0354441.1 cyclodeaminase/cyclohydrolase family protein [Chloroflexota bacterium]HBW50993.1 formiminotransferase-cyclodeaminase [Herpetosiphon sp.]
MTLLQVPITEFLDQLATKEPVPGGGSVAAVSGAMAAGLISMVCSLTLGKKKYAEVEDEIRGLMDRSESLRRELQELADADVEAFRRLSAAYKLPRETTADIAIRRDAIQKATRIATDVPLRAAQAAAAILPLCSPAAQKGNSAAVSDVGVAVLLAQAAVRSALLNVEINLNTLEDQFYVRETRAEVAKLTATLHDDTEAVMALVNQQLQG